MTTPDSTTRLLHEWVACAAELRPDAPAVIDQDTVLTYGQLAERARQVAAALRSVGCRESDRVAILMPRSVEGVTSVLGVLEAGCGCVPLEPADAVTRTAEMVRQTEPAALLAGAESEEILERLRARRVLRGVPVGWMGDGSGPDVAFTGADVQGLRPQAPPIRRDSVDLAYVLFTSGTSGRPKGVPLAHGNIRPFIEWAVEHFALGPYDRLAGHAPLTFALSIFDVFATLVAGAELHLPPRRGMRHLPHDADFIESRALTVWSSVPSRLTAIARCAGLDNRDLEVLRHVSCYGDVLPPPTLMYWKRRLPGTVFTNLYGSTETTVASGYYRVPDDYTDGTSPVPVGHPCSGDDLLLLDDDLRPVEDGEVGEICVSGAGLARGYWRDPERSSDVFVPDPRSADGSAVLFRTGDLGRRDGGGVLRFVGPVRFRIEEAGHRLEPVELESVILQLEGISGCAVVPLRMNGSNGGARLGCGYVPCNGGPLRTSELERQLARDLPRAMIPSTWLVLDELPVDHRGKVDRVRVREMFGGGEGGPTSAPTRRRRLTAAGG